MRLIDADALKKSLEKLWNVHNDQDFANKDVWREIENAPTVEPERKKGEWVWEKKIPFERCRCSECGYCRQLKFPEPDYFCPNCGADMRSER